MSADPYFPITVKQRLPTPLNGTLFTTTRKVAAEKLLPVIGGTMADELGPDWADSIVIGVSDGPDRSRGILTVTHVRIPSEEQQLSSNWEQVAIQIGGKEYDGVIRSVILPASSYQNNAPAMDSAMPVVADGLFDGDGYLLYDRECVKSGIELEPTFRVDRRTYVKPATHTGRIAYADRNTASTSDSFVTDGTAVSTGLQIIDSKVTPLGNGKSIKETVTADAWPVHTGSRWDENLNASVLFTEQFVAPTTGLSSPHTDVSIVNKDRSLKRTEVIPTAALKSYYSVIPARVDLGDLPRELLSVNVVWTSQYSIGTQDFAFFKTATGKSWSLGESHTDSANSSASIMPEVQFKFRDVSSSNLPGSLHEFYVSVPVTEAKILSRLGAALWPTFKPESTTITASGQSIRVSVSASASLSGTVSNNVVVESGWSKGTSDDVGGGLSHSSIQIPACIHGAIALTGGTAMSQVVSATALIGMSHSAVGSVSSTMTKSGTAFGTVSPQTLPATGTVTKIPTKGLYLMNAQIARPKWGFCLVSALVFNAKNLK